MLKSMLVIVSIIVLISSFSLACVTTNQVTENKSTITPDTNVGQVDTINEQRYLLKYDNGVFSDSYYFTYPIGHRVSFSPPVTPFKINTIYIRGKRTDFPNAENKTYTVNILDSNSGKELYSCDYPYSKFSTDFTTVAHTINPPVIVTDNFTVDFISQSEGVKEGEKSKVAIYILYDSTLSTNEHIGVSSLGFYSDAWVENLITKDPKFSHSVWAIQTEGTGQAISGKPPFVIIGTENICNAPH